MKKILVLLLSLALIAGLTSCEQEEAVEIAYVEWACATASTYVVKTVLEDMGYNVRLTSVSAAAMWQSLASGDMDAMTTAWLPETHRDYYESVADDVVDLGPNYLGARLALVVPDYVPINSLQELLDNAEQFDNQIIGIDPGAGLMGLTEDFIANNDAELTLIEGSDATMAAALGDAIQREEWIVVTGWAPHWKFARWDLKILDDPNNEFGAEETINTIVRKGLDEDMPEVYAMLDNFSWGDDEIGAVMELNEEMSPEESARKWVDENQDIVQTWIP